MSLNGLFNTQFPLTIDGTQSLDVSSLTVDGQTIDLTALVPYTGADKPVDVGAQPIRTTHTAVLPQDVVNKALLDFDIANISVLVGNNFLQTTTAFPQTVQGAVTFQKGITTSDNTDTTLASRVEVGPNYQSVLTSADVTVGQHFGSITNVGSVYEATSTNNPTPTLIVFPIVAGERYNLQLETLADDPLYDVTLDIYQSQDGVTPFPNFNDAVIDSPVFAPASTVFHQTNASFVATTTGSVVITPVTFNPSGITTVKWKNLSTFGMGVSLTNATYPSLTADRVAVLNDRKQLVSSGISITKLDFLDNVSSDIQTQLNTLSSNKADITYVNTQDGLRVLKAGDTMTGALTVNATVSTGDRVIGSVDGGGNFWLGLRGSGTEIQRLAINLNGDATTGEVSYISMAKRLDMGANRIQTTFSPVLGSDVINRTFADNTYVSLSILASYLPLVGGTLTGNLTITSSSAPLITSVTGLNASTTENIRLVSLSNHYDEKTGETYLFTGGAGYMMIGRNTTRDASTVNLMLGAPGTNVSEIISTRSDGLGFLPLNFAGSSYRFTTGNVLSDENIQITGAKVVEFGFGVSGKETNAGKIGYQTFSTGLDIVGAGVPSASRLVRIYDRLGIGANPDHSLDVTGAIRAFGNGVGGPSAIFSENASAGNAYAIMFLRNNNAGSGCFWFLNSTTRSEDGGANTATLRNDIGSMRLQSNAGAGIIVQGGTGRVGIGTASPDGDLHVQLAGGVAGWDRFVVKTTSFWGDGTSVRSETAGVQFGTLFNIMLNNPHINTSSTGDATLRMGRGGGVASGRWWEVACKANNQFNIGVEGQRDLVITPAGVLSFAGGGVHHSIDNNLITKPGALCIGNITQNYGDASGQGANQGWGAGIMMDCLDFTSIHVHDSALRVASFMSYFGPVNTFVMGRDVGWGASDVLTASNHRVDGRMNIGTTGARAKAGISGGTTGTAPGNVASWPDNVNGLLISTDVNQGANSPGLMLAFTGAGYVTSLTPNVSWNNLFLYGATIGAGYFGAFTSTLGASGWINVSDEREKEDIHDLNTSSSLQRVLAVRPKHYRRKYCDKGAPVPDKVKQTRCIGFLAQEIKRTNPHCVSEWDNDNVEKTEEDDGKRLALCYTDYVVHLCGAVQEQQKMIEAQAKRVETLEAREAVWLEHARQQEATIKDQAERLAKAEARLEKVAGLLAQMLPR